MTPVPTAYRGTMFRSRLEARWAVFFNAMKIPWAYEPYRVETAGGGYLPDFLIGSLGPECPACPAINEAQRLENGIPLLRQGMSYVEIKPYRPELDYIGMLMNVDNVVLLGGIPRLSYGTWLWPHLRKDDVNWTSFCFWHDRHDGCSIDGGSWAPGLHGMQDRERVDRIPKTIGKRSKGGCDIDDEAQAYEHARYFRFAE